MAYIETAPGSDIELAFSNLNLPKEYFVPEGFPARAAAIAGLEPKGTVEAHREVLHELGCFPGGYEITPARALMKSIDRQVTEDKFRNWEDGQPFATATHQAWGSGILRGIMSSIRRRSLLPVQLAYVVEESRYSLETMQYLDEILGGGVPAIVLPEVTRRGGRPFNYSELGFYECAAQIKPEMVVAKEGYRRLHDSLWSQGVHGAIVDPHHMVRASLHDPDYHLDLDRLKNDMEDAGTPIMGLHASAGRIDSAQPGDVRRSLAELDALLKSPEALGRTALGDLLAWGYGTFRSQKARKGMLPEARLAERSISMAEAKEQAGGEGAKPHDVIGALARHPIEARLREESIFNYSYFTPRRKIRVTSEIPHEGLVAYLEAQGKTMSQANFILLHQTAAAHLVQFFAMQDNHTP
jgi:hypothetical protein